MIALYPSRFDEFTLARINPDLVVLGAGSLFELVYLYGLSVWLNRPGFPRQFGALAMTAPLRNRKFLTT